MITPHFRFVPYVGAMPIAFGMGRAEVAFLIGEPDFVHRNFLGETTEYRWENRCRITYAKADETVIEMEFESGLVLGLDGAANLLDDPGLIEELIRRDPDPRESCGILVFLGLGLSTGVPDQEDPARRSIAVFAKGRWDGAAGGLRPYRPASPAADPGEGPPP